MKVLVVDDSEMIRNFHSYILKNMGCQVVTAVDGADAIEKVLSSETPFTMIITDINMPNMDGYLLVERLREEADYQETPIIIISTEEEMEDKAKGFAVGANIYLVKPTDPVALGESIRTFMPKNYMKGSQL
jgi:two-component system chemotaxis response regulator CheY